MTEIIRVGGLELRFLQSRHDTRNGLDLFEMTLQPRARMPVPHHHESWDETVYGLEGVVAWRVDGRDVEIGQGRTPFIPRGTIHGFRNDATLPASCLCILTPGVVLGPEYFPEMAALAARTPPDPEALRRTMLRHGLVPAPAA